MSAEEIADQRIAYLDSLYKAWIEGNGEAGDELSGIAMGGYPYARELIRKREEGSLQTREILNESVSNHE